MNNPKSVLLLFSLGTSLMTSANALANTEICRKVFENIQTQKTDVEFLVKDYADISKMDPLKNGTKQNFKLLLLSIFQQIENEYGPRSLKEKIISDLNWENFKKDLLKKSSALKTTNEQYFFIADMFAKFNDAHISVELPSSLAYVLPVQFVHQEDGPNLNKKIIAAYVEKKISTGTDKETVDTRLPEVGDQLISINGMSPEQFQKLTPVFDAAGNRLTNQTLFALNIGRLREERGVPLSTRLANPNVVLQFRSDKDGSIYQTTLKYKMSGIGLIGAGLNGNKNPRLIFPKKESNKPVITAKNALNTIAPETAKMINLFDRLLKAEVPIEKGYRTEADDAQKRQNITTEGKKIQIGDTTPYFELPKDFEEITPPEVIPGFMPDTNFKKLLNGNFFFAGKYQKDGKTVGFLRIPSYSPHDFSTILQSLRYYVGRLQAETDYLVIDQTRNPGGMVVFSDLLIKSLVGQLDSTVHMKFAVKPTEGFMRQFAELYDAVLKNADGLFSEEEIKAFAPRLKAEYEKIRYAREHRLDLSQPIDFSLISLYFEAALDKAFIEQLASGEKSSNISLNKALVRDAEQFFESNNKLKSFKERLNKSGLDQNQKLQKLVYTFVMIKNFEKLVGAKILEPALYTKPVAMLIDQLDFSGGDATVATLQDYNRVVLIGVGSQRTAGAGGTVEKKEFNGLLNFVVHMTTSLMVRLKGVFVENYGVTAQHYVPVLVSDYKDGFTNLFDRITDKVTETLPEAEAQAQQLENKLKQTAAQKQKTK